ncbi:MAG: hypothetical protein KAH17_02345 [Bacteroidales bacterium]|nr:hypothetical protein [Bacteroidales bacterium]
MKQLNFLISVLILIFSTSILNPGYSQSSSQKENQFPLKPVLDVASYTNSNMKSTPDYGPLLTTHWFIDSTSSEWFILDPTRLSL